MGNRILRDSEDELWNDSDLAEIELKPSPPAGKSGTLTPRGKLFAIILGVLTLAIAVGIMLWYVLSAPDISAKTYGFKVIDSQSVEITFVVAKPPEEKAECLLEALNKSYAQVGSKTVAIPATELRETSYKTSIATSELATTAVVQQCKIVN